eukprot:jgi/Botrbrau1/1640/Bobra.0185s0050.1
MIPGQASPVHAGQAAPVTAGQASANGTCQEINRSTGQETFRSTGQESPVKAGQAPPTDTGPASTGRAASKASSGNPSQADHLNVGQASAWRPSQPHPAKARTATCCGRDGAGLDGPPGGWRTRCWEGVDWGSLTAVVVTTVVLFVVTVMAHNKVIGLQPVLQNAARARMAADPDMIWGLCVQSRNQLAGANTSQVSMLLHCSKPAELASSIPLSGYASGPVGLFPIPSLPILIFALAEAAASLRAQCYPVQSVLAAARSGTSDDVEAACKHVASSQLVDPWETFSNYNIGPYQYCNCTMWRNLLQNVTLNGGVYQDPPCVTVKDVINTEDKSIVRVASDKQNNPFRIDFVLPQSAMDWLKITYARISPYGNPDVWSIANETCGIEDTDQYSASVELEKSMPYSCTDGVDNANWEKYTSVYAQVKETFSTSFLGIPGGYDDMYAIYTGLLGALFGSAATLIGLLWIAVWRVVSPSTVKNRAEDEEQIRLLHPYMSILRAGQLVPHPLRI